MPYLSPAILEALGLRQWPEDEQEPVYESPMDAYRRGERAPVSPYAGITPMVPSPVTPAPEPNPYRQVGSMLWTGEEPSTTQPERMIPTVTSLPIMEGPSGERTLRAPEGTATWRAGPQGFPPPGRFNDPADVARVNTRLEQERSFQEHTKARLAEAERRRVEEPRQRVIQGLLNRYQQAVRDSESSLPATRAAGGAAVQALAPILMKLLPGGQQLFGGGGGGTAGAPPPGIAIRYDAQGNPTGYTQTAPPPKTLPVSTTPEAVFEEWSRPGGRFAGRTKNSLSGKELTEINAEATNRLNQASEIRGGSFRLVPTWDSKLKRSVPMDLNAVKEANLREPGRFRLLSEPGAQYESKMDIVAPWNLHPLTKSDVRIPVDVDSLNRLDGRVTPDEVAAEQQSDRPSIVLMDRNDWSDVIAPIRGVWKSYQEVSGDIQKQLGVTTPEAVITRLETAGAAALGSSKLAVDVQAQVSHAIRMLRAMGVRGNLASEQIEREIKGTTFTAGMRSDVAARVLHNTQSQIRNILESYTNVSDFNMRRDVGGGAVPQIPSTAGGTLPRPNAGEEVRWDKQGRAFVRRNGQKIQVQP